MRTAVSRTLLGIFRVVTVTVLATLLAFCVALFFGIVGIVLTKMIRGTALPDMSIAYRQVALPIAAVALVAAFVVALVSEIRHFRAARRREEIAPRRRAA